MGPWDSTEIVSSSATTAGHARSALAIHRSFPETDVWSRPANAAVAPATYREKGPRESRPGRRLSRSTGPALAACDRPRVFTPVPLLLALDDKHVTSREPILGLAIVTSR